MQSKKVKILHIEDRFYHEFGYQLNNFAKFHSKDFEFIILTSYSLLPWRINLTKEELQKKDKEFEIKHSIRIVRLEKFFEIESRVFIKNLIKEIKGINPDIIFAHGLETFTAIRIILNKIAKKYLVFSDTHTLHNLSRIRVIGYLFRLCLRYFISPILNKKEIIVFYTAEENGQILKNNYGIKSDNIKNGLIGTDTAKFYFSTEQRVLKRSNYNISDNDCVILFTGKIDNFKKPHLILDAIKIIEKDFDKKILLLFIGDRDMNYFNNYFKPKFNNKNISLVYEDRKPNDVLFEYYSMADLAVFPTYNTLSCLDAQSCALPVIMEANFTNKERLKLGGLLFEKGNIFDLADKIKLLINDNDLRKQLAMDGEKYIKNNYDYKTIIRNIESIMLEKYFSKINKLVS